MAMTEQQQEILDEALERFESALEKERDQRKKSVEDDEFVLDEDGQWEEEVAEKRANRPRYTIDRVSTALNQLNGDQRQTRTQIKVRPADGGDKEVARIMSGLIRKIENANDAADIYDLAYECISRGGYGGWRISTEYKNEGSFDQDVIIRPIKSAATSLYMDIDAEQYDKSDSMWGFLVKSMSEQAFKAKFPNATITNFTDEKYTTGTSSYWFEDNMVQVAEYWRVNLKPVRLALLSDGRVINLDEDGAVVDELESQGVTILKERTAKIREVEMYLMNGAELLSGAQKWAGKYIPLIPAFGRVGNVGQKEYVQGLVRKAKDPARIYNYTVSTVVEASALAPKDPIWITGKQAKGYESKLKSFNNSNSPFMLYNADPEAPGIPQRGGAPAVQQALLGQLNTAAEDLYATTGVYPSAMGNAPQLLSEKSVMAQAEKGDRGAYVFKDNLNKSIKHSGVVLADLLPRILDKEQIVTIMNFDGTPEDVRINAMGMDKFNQPIIDSQTGKEVIVNDLSYGNYDVYIETGPAYSTQRAESARQLIDLASASPVFEQSAADLIAKNLDIIESDELYKRVREYMVRNGLAKPTPEEVKELGLDQPQQPSEEQTALLENVKLQNAEIIAKIEKINAETDNIDSKTLDNNTTAQKTMVEAYNKLIDAYKTQKEIGINLGISETQVLQAQQALLNLSQEELIKGNV